MVSQRSKKIAKMKMQTAKVLWQEDRKDAAFLVLESVNDPRADGLRESMGFGDDYEIGQVATGGVSWTIFGVTLVLVMIVSFGTGHLLNFGGAANAAPASISDPDSIGTRIAPMPEPAVDLNEPIVETTVTASQMRLTRAAVETQQSDTTRLLEATQTAGYEQATATENARATQIAGQ